MRLIDAEELIRHLIDWALGCSPMETDKGETRALRQREYDTIEQIVCMIERAPTMTDGARNRNEAEVLKAYQREIDRAAKIPEVRNPVAWALYHVWRQFDERGKGKAYAAD